MVELIGLILLPLILAFILTLSFVSRGNSLIERIKFVLTLHPELGLMKQGLLWLVILAPILYFVATGSLAWNEYNILLTADGFDNFLQISVLPIALLSLAIPLSVLISRLHSTEQSAKQIEIVSYKNNLDTYRSHRQDLFSYFGQIGETDYLSCIKVNFKVHPRLHKNFSLGLPKDGLPEPNIPAFKDIESELVSARNDIHITLKDIDSHKTFSHYLFACSTIFRLSNKLGIPEIYIGLADKGVLVPVKINTQPELESILTVGTTTKELIAAFRIAKSFYLNLCDFAGVIPDIGATDVQKYIDHSQINGNQSVERLHKEEIQSAINASKGVA